MPEGSPPTRDVMTGIRLATAVALAAACPLLALLFSQPDLQAVFFPGYRRFSRALMSALADVTSVVPFAVWDWLLAGLAVAAIATLARRIRRHQRVLPWFSVVALIVAATAFLGTAGWALNHYAPRLSQDLGLEVGQHSEDQLASATSHYLDQAASRAALVPREEDGTLSQQDFYELARIAGASYAPLAQRCETFSGSTAPVKSLLLLGEPLLFSGHTGIFWAATAEPGVPPNTATAELPFTMCHEAAHRLGIASEEEANFSAFLACSASDDVRLSYSGYYSAFNYCANALFAEDPERARQVVLEALAGENGTGVALVMQDRSATRAHYQAYEGPFEDVGTTVNDAYLKSFGERAGVRSYGLVVDYLLAWLDE
ncbi:MAG: DUF3810 domain-containing protein [Coriobacteriaceae bacterium]|uniref:DUF3810 domain-containing protein n=1 Tax=Tractidigestivibacter sp. TaxID=2847320 RepID=UPI002A8147B1|nr:DUF3810 domain-containing protein [Tractidigestivibacter sp.]MCI6274810.1 DUF3810 domain-containing protein [Coriobacteriaceae bacterium]MCI6844390.1 DUF3810 domain-containing protein [Coriobacteriaceae bacterium]MCI7438521.1 DUF3810 domain-containing protein [Coriobacteriaceae bacterium]MDD7583269.1 DUF3810 domain-containing protein [Coriobacteriaceae bacterium]MDY4533948.1 DUF3810 domain-containing protein [Tractidigestivibacter sp.]